MFWALTTLSYLMLFAVAFIASRLAVRRRYRPFVWLIILTSPFGFNSFAGYLGRYDAIVACAIVSLVYVGGAFACDAGRGSRIGLPLAVLAMTVAAACVTLSEEFALALVIPALLACAFRVATARQRAGAWAREVRRVAAVALIPVAAGLAFAAWSFASPASEATIRRAQIAMGDSTSPLDLDAAHALGMSLSQERRYVDGFGGFNVNFSIATWCLVFLATCAALATLMRIRPRWYWASAVYLVGTTVLISEFGIDFRRWWLIAFTSQLATAALLAPANSARAGAAAEPGSHRARRPGTVSSATGRRATVAALLVACVALELNSGVFHPGFILTAEYWKGDASYWFPGHHRAACILHLSSSNCSST